MSIICKVLPRRGATPRELQELGSALRRWYARESREHGIALYTNLEDINALRQGHLPSAGVLGGRAKQRRAIILAVRAGRWYSLEGTRKSFEQDIPPKLVQDVLIDGESWTRVGEPTLTPPSVEGDSAGLP
jgi:hypothetical protein